MVIKKSKLYYDRRLVDQSVLVSGTLEIFFRQLRVCYFVAPSLTRGRVCNLLLLLVIASAVLLGSQSRGTHDDILLSQFLRLPQPGGPGPRIYIPQEQGGPVIPPGTGFPLCRLLRLAGNAVEVLFPASTWAFKEISPKSYTGCSKQTSFLIWHFIFKKGS
jgi:hypothetical protein